MSSYQEIYIVIIYFEFILEFFWSLYMPPLLVWFHNPPTPGGDIQMHVIWDLGNPTTQSGTLGHISSSPLIFFSETSKIRFELGDSQAENEAFFSFRLKLLTISSWSKAIHHLLGDSWCQLDSNNWQELALWDLLSEYLRNSWERLLYTYTGCDFLVLFRMLEIMLCPKSATLFFSFSFFRGAYQSGLNSSKSYCI